MRRSFLIHVAGAFVTILAFVAGSNWSRSSKAEYRVESEMVTANANAVPIGSSRAVDESVSESPPLSSEGSSSGEEIGSDQDDSEAAAEPLSADQVESLVRKSIRSLDPVERRLAFARLLREMMSDSFTVEQAALIRSQLYHQGASGEQWRLFDYGWAAKFPEAAIAFIDEISQQHLNGYLGSMLPGLASVEPQTAINLYESFESDLQVRLRRRLYEGLIHNDREFATNYVFASANPELRDWRPMDEFTRQLADEQGLQATLDWAAELPEGSLRGNAWSALFAKWAARDPLSVSEALLEMPISTDRDLAINGFTAALAGQDPEGAVTWAAEISNPGLREAALVRAGTRYFQQDQSAATAWFASSGLPATALNRMSQTNQ